MSNTKTKLIIEITPSTSNNCTSTIHIIKPLASTGTSLVTKYHTRNMSLSSSWEEQRPSSKEKPFNRENSNSSRAMNTLEEQAEQTSKLFTTTITSLAADVDALKHLTTWKDILQMDNDGESRNDDGVDLEERREEFLESLCDLDDAVAAVEKKVSVLRQIVSEEQRALDNLNMLHQDTVDQNENLQYLVDRCRNMTMKNPAEEAKVSGGGDRGARSEASSTLRTSTDHCNKAAQKTATKAQPSPSIYGFHTTKSSNSSIKTAPSNNEENRAHTDGLSCYFDPVTQQELESVPRTTRGRVQIPVINEALANIGSCFRKAAVKKRREQRLLEESKHAVLSSHKYETSYDEGMDDEELLRNLVVTEQQLRQSCAFFACGEGTARTVLAVLKELKRIKQVPAKKKGLFTYKLCLD